MNDYSINLIPKVEKILSNLIGVCHTEESDRLPSYSEQTTDIICTRNSMEVCSISKRKDFEDKKVLVAPYDAHEKNEFPLRTTTTNSFLRNKVNHAILYVSGESKRDMLQNVLQKGSLNEYPARIIHEMKDVTLVTDIEINQM